MLKKPYRKIESFDIENALCTPIPESLRNIRLVKVYELAPRVGNLSSLALGNA